jgi:hypothetical protein
MSWRILLTISLLAPLLHFAEAQVKSAHSGVVALPQGSLTRIPSPDRRWTLIFECPDNCRERKLWVEESTSNARKLVKEYDRRLAIGWAPDSQRFFVNDDYGSDGSKSYVIDPASLKATDLGTIIVNNDAEASQFLKAGHSYLRAKHWLNSHKLIVVLFGHFDDSTPRHVPESFTIKYEVDLNGGARKVSQQSIEEPQ